MRIIQKKYSGKQELFFSPFFLKRLLFLNVRTNKKMKKGQLEKNERIGVSQYTNYYIWPN